MSRDRRAELERLQNEIAQLRRTLESPTPFPHLSKRTLRLRELHRTATDRVAALEAKLATANRINHAQRGLLERLEAEHRARFAERVATRIGDGILGTFEVLGALA